ncbi:MAG: CrcB family protein [Planctomycetota bacterium]|nr:CrcB family protein [Planctomycetota bacterium]MDA1105185.1 CrcB family protein [Planctomycetota bacterium]
MSVTAASGIGVVSAVLAIDASDIVPLAVSTAAGVALRVAMHALDDRCGRPRWKSTLWCNVTGCVLAGAVLGQTAGTPLGNLTEDHRRICVWLMAILGGFTTYSGLCLDTIHLARARRAAASVTVLVFTVVGGVFLAVWFSRLPVTVAIIVPPMLWLVLGVPWRPRASREMASRPAPEDAVASLRPIQPQPLRATAGMALIAATGGLFGGAVRLAADPLLAGVGVAHAERWSMLGANLVGAALIGVVAARCSGAHAGAFWRTGFCGGLTTVSALATLSASATLDGERSAAMTLLIVSLVVGPTLTLAVERASAPTAAFTPR